MMTFRDNAAAVFAALVILFPSASNLSAAVTLGGGGDGTSNPPSWTVVGNPTVSINGGDATLAGPGIGGIQRTYSTSSDGTYLLGFQLGMTDKNSPVHSELRVSWGGQVLYNGDISSMPLTTFSFEVSGGDSGASSLQFDVIRNTLAGDVNGDGVVNFADLGLVTGNYGSHGTWDQGDVSGDGLVNFADLGLIVGNYGQTLTSVRTFNEAHVSNARVTMLNIVPEPASILVWSLLGGLAVAAGCRRRSPPAA